MHAALFQAEAQHNVAELSGLVRSIGVESSNEDTVIYAVETLEREPIRVEFVRDIGYVVGPRVFESMQALLSEASPEYRKAFAARVSESLMARLQGLAPLTKPPA